jgi:hypothetical protein
MMKYYHPILSLLTPPLSSHSLNFVHSPSPAALWPFFSWLRNSIASHADNWHTTCFPCTHLR